MKYKLTLSKRGLKMKLILFKKSRIFVALFLRARFYIILLGFLILGHKASANSDANAKFKNELKQKSLTNKSNKTQVNRESSTNKNNKSKIRKPASVEDMDPNLPPPTPSGGTRD